MNTRNALILLLCVFVCMLNAQIAQNNNATLNDLAFFVQVNNPKYAGAEGSRYLFEEFVPVKINQIKTSHAVRFNIVENVIEFKDSDGEIKGLSKEEEYKIVLLDGTNRIFVTKRFVDDDAKALGKTFFELMYANEHFELFKKERIKFQEAKPAKSSYEPEKSAKFIELPAVFYVNFSDSGTEELVQIPRKKKKLKDFFDDSYASIDKYTKKNSLQLDVSSDLVKILNHYIQTK